MSKISESRLAEHAEEIRKLGKRAVADIIEIGRRLTEVKTLAGHGNWILWLNREFGWSTVTAEKWMNVYALSLKFKPNLNLSLPLGVLYKLAAPSTPEAVVDAVVARAEAGEKITREAVSCEVRTRRIKYDIPEEALKVRRVPVDTPAIDETPTPSERAVITILPIEPDQNRRPIVTLSHIEAQKRDRDLEEAITEY